MIKTKKTRNFVKNIKLTIISESDAKTRGVLILKEGNTFITSDGSNNYVCGKCNTILLQNYNKLNFQNAVLKCNNCGRYNSLDKKSIYLNTPVTIQDIDELPNPKELMSGLSSMWANHKLSNDFFEIHRKFLNRWEEHQGDRPNILYHYTSLQGLQGILDSSKMWFSDIAFLNDASEMQLAIDMIESFIAEIGNDLSDVETELLRRSSVSSSPSSCSDGFFVSCFCSNSDLLSQWRAYGNNGKGFALGFNTKRIGNSNNFRVRKVLYDKNIQSRLIRELIKDTLNLLREVSKGKTIEDLDKQDNILPTFSAFLSNHLTELLCTFKHESFKEEDEWRVIYNFTRHNDVNDLKFREGNDFPIPFVEMPLSKEIKGMPNSELVEIVYGPTLHEELTKKSLTLLLETKNLEFVEVRKSNAPLR